VARGIDGAATRPAVFVLLGRERSIDVATDALPRGFVTLVTDRLTTGTIKLALASPPWSRALLEQLSDPAGTSLRMVGGARVEGRRFDAVTDAVSDALPLGVRHGDGTFDTRPTTVVGLGDQVIVLGAPDATFPREATFTATAPVPRAAEVRVLVIGWNHRVPTLVADLAATSGTRFVVTSLSDVDADLRRSEIDDGALGATKCSFLTGSVDDAATLRRVAHDSEPASVVVTSTLLQPVRDPTIDLAAADAQAVLAALALVRGATLPGTPVLLDLFLPRDHGVAALAAGPGVVATHELTASTLAGFAYDAVLATLTKAIFADDSAPPFVEPFTPDDDQPHAFGDAYRALLDAGRVLVGYADDDGEPVLAPPSDCPIPPGAPLLVLDTSGARRP
jgi:hypothetical protein